MLQIKSHIGHNALGVIWKPVPPHHLNGDLIGYKLMISLVTIGGRSVLTGQTKVKLIHPSVNQMTLSALQPNSQYSISVLAYNQFGDGVLSSPRIGGK